MLIVSYNSTSTSSLKKFMDSKVHELGNVVAVMVQEHHMADEQQIDAFSASMAEVGWGSFLAPAKKCDSGLSSGGVGILVKLQLGSKPSQATPRVAEHLKHRMIACLLEIPAVGEVELWICTAGQAKGLAKRMWR